MWCRDGKRGRRITREEIVKSMSLQDAIQVFKDTNCYGTMDIAKSVILKALEQEPVLDKIRVEIKKSSHGKWYIGRLDGKTEEVLLLDEVLQIIDKYKAEQEET